MSRTRLTAALLVAAFLTILAVKLASTPSSPAADATPAEQALAAAAGQPVFLCFRSGVTQPGNCLPCREMARITAELAPRFTGRAAFVDVSLDDDTTEGRLIQQHQVQVKPTCVLLDRDHRVVEKRVGVWPADELAARLDELSR